ncbi:MAG: substrate-binding domain-containing protein [Propionibacteriaceae bacterium]|jgi:DNA-binding LacI/PurR family transcriptional regulator|nr:substrate-binding domain-containing protein [Propionibacteriaceae bacterium]
MKDVAKAAGVSLSTVSYALNSNRPISPATRDRVMAAVDDLGYTRNAAARALAGRRSHVLALVLPPTSTSFSATIGQFVAGAVAAAEEHGYTLVIWPFAWDDQAKVDQLVRQKLADGVLVMEVTLDDQRITALERAHVPFTMIGRTAELAGRSWVDIDFEATMAETLDRLTALGHTRVALLNHSNRMLDARYGPAVRTRDAFLDQTARRRLVGYHTPCDDTALAGRGAAAQIWGHDPDITAVITLHELAAIGLVNWLTVEDRAIPDDVSVIGIATSPLITALSVPPLTAMRAPGPDLGRTAIYELIDVIDAEPRRDRPRLIPCTYTEGGTLAPAQPGHPARKVRS